MSGSGKKPHRDSGMILREAAQRLDVPTRRLFLRQVVVSVR
jgi:hypothetical protein